MTRKRPNTPPEQSAESGMSGVAPSAGRRETALAALRAGRLFLESDSYREAIESFSEAADGRLVSELSGAERASLLCGLARCHLALGAHEKARRCVESVEALSLSAEDRIITAEAQVILAKTEAKGGRFEASLAAAQRAYTVLRSESDCPLLAEASKALGTAHAELGSITAARDCFTECLVCCRRLEDEEGAAGAYNNLGILAKRSGDLIAAIDYFEHALEIDERLGNAAAVARRLNNLGIALYRMSRWDEAEKHLLRAFDIFGRLGATRDVVSVESALGNLRRVRRDWNGARRHLDSVLAASRESGFLRAEALALEFLGDLEKDLGDYDAALSSLDLSLASARELSADSDVISEVLRRRAEVFLALGRLDEAEQDCLAALDLCGRIGDRLEEGSVLRVLAAVYYARDDLTLARTFVERAETALRAIGSAFELAMVMLTDGAAVARAMRGRATRRETPASAGGESDEPLSRFDPDYAEARLCAARELFRAAGADYWAAVCSLEMARMLCAAGESDRAPAWLERARPELAGSGATADLRALSDLQAELDRGLSARDESGGDRYTLIARAARLLERGADTARSLHAFASFIADAVSADRVVLFHSDTGGEPLIVTSADSTGRRLAEVRRFVRSVGDRYGLTVPLVGSSTVPGRTRMPRHLAAVALVPSSDSVEAAGGHLLYADRIRRAGELPAFGVADVELLAAAAGLLEGEHRGAERDTGVARSRGVGASVGLISRDPSMLGILDNVEKLGRSDVPVLLLGESGVGKDVIARAIHCCAPGGGRLVALNSAAIPQELQESELFGHVKGAFTDADRDREGLIEAAANGTLFLDEIGDMSLGLQIKLLRFLQSGEYRRVGDNTIRQSNARVISASNRDLMEEVAAGSFRRDLFYRLSTFVIEVPPLRERPGDIRPLMEHFLKMYAGVEGKEIAGFSEEVAGLFLSYDWCGNNVRELENEVRRAVAFCESGDLIRLEHVRPELATLNSGSRDQQGLPRCGGTLKEQVEALERSRILEALAGCSQSKQMAAEALGLSRTGLYTKMRKYLID
ncbi:MAG: sigma 54-interacting transcriptional regulator [Candidatus Eisenbacteria bacterium]|nr:sigma 54-interacting transcriptional regulator [Candidatus Eisenbacteria bacterium]